MKPIIIPASIEAVATRRDRTLKITIGTNELPPEVAASILSLQKKQTHFEVKVLKQQRPVVTRLSRLLFSKCDPGGLPPLQYLRV